MIRQKSFLFILLRVALSSIRNNTLLLTSESILLGGKDMRYEDLKDVLTVKDITEFLGISRAKAYELVHSGSFIQ
ncbi:hypothetical protein RCG17_22810 [Neobacillus sp. PS3-12]|uniref:helix-turn-helix transcriptional regulator n=1 Tax=Neobacillus sp. PS3-12 TaxID=3070677 RepID=UPI0027E0AA12|nr:hypothetical protein [Neobacillus sp. PS3-12]WML52191.1 hypothetical protein RCG17_22810 [Neobacillus sp. PS3-12]